MGRRERKRENRIKVMMSIIIVLLMVFSAFGIIIGSYTSDIRFGRLKFVATQEGYYQTQINKQTVIFYSLPQDSIIVNAEQGALERIFSSPLFITSFDPNNANESLQFIEVARFDLASSMPDKFVMHSVSDYSEAYAALSVVGCANATFQAPVLYFNVSDTTGIYLQGDCIFFSGRGIDFLRLRDRVLYEYYGVLKQGQAAR
jgi:hypothetical protein